MESHISRPGQDVSVSWFRAVPPFSPGHERHPCTWVHSAGSSTHRAHASIQGASNSTPRWRAAASGSLTPGPRRWAAPSCLCLVMTPKYKARPHGLVLHVRYNACCPTHTRAGWRMARTVLTMYADALVHSWCSTAAGCVRPGEAGQRGDRHAPRERLWHRCARRALPQHLR